MLHRRLTLACLLFLALLPPVARHVGQPFLVAQFTLIMIMGLAVVSLDLVLGFGGLVSFAHAAFMGLGAYVVGILDHHASNGDAFLGILPGTTQALLAWPLAMGVAAFAALVIGLVCLQTSGMVFIMLSLAFAQMIFFSFVAWTEYGGDDGMPLSGRSDLPGIDLGDDGRFYYVVLVLLAASLFLCRRIVASRFGMVLRGARQNPTRMAAIGVNIKRYQLAAFVISAALAGLAGALLANFQIFVSTADLEWSRPGELVSMVVLGGAGTLLGPLLGAAAYELLQMVTGIWTTHWPLVFGPALILVVLFAPGGLLGIATRRR